MRPLRLLLARLLMEGARELIDAAGALRGVTVSSPRQFESTAVGHHAGGRFLAINSGRAADVINCDPNRRAPR